MLHFAVICLALNRILVAGGTHGNEYTGVYVLKRLMHQQAKLVQSYPSLTIQPLLANPAAHNANRRFIDTDLNRMFAEEHLKAPLPPQSFEAARAHQIAAEFGSGVVQVAIDMHTTTSNMGAVIICSNWSPLTMRAAAYCQQHWEAECEADAAECNNLPQPHALRILMQDGDSRATSPHLCSVGLDGVEIEVGPTPNGLVRADCVASTERALRLLLRYFDLHYSGDAPRVGDEFEVYLDMGKVPFEDGLDADSPIPSAIVHPTLQDRDFTPLRRGEPLYLRLDGSSVPYDGRCGDEVYPVFVNEAAYYNKASGSGICMTRRVMRKVPTEEEVLAARGADQASAAAAEDASAGQ